MPDEFPYDVFLSHSSKDKAVVRSSTLSASNGERAGVRCRRRNVAERLRALFSQPSTLNYQPAKRLEHSRVLVLCMSANAFGSDWAQLESGTFRFPMP